MCKIVKGLAIQVHTYLDSLSNLTKVRATDEADFLQDYNSPSQTIRAYINPPNLRPVSFKTLKARKGRILCFSDKEPNKAWLSWINNNNLDVLTYGEPSKSTLIKMLTSGAVGITLSKPAAESLVSIKGIKPIQAYYWTIQSLIDLELKQPVSNEDLLDSMISGLEISANALSKNISNLEGIRLAAQVSPTRAIPGLVYLQMACKDQISQDLISYYKQQMTDKKLSPKVALISCCHNRYKWQQNTQTGLSVLQEQIFQP